GSSGKTTTKELAGAILAKAGKTLATPASFNNEVGVPKTLAMLTAAHRFAVVEMGARMPGNIRFLCELARPDVCGIVNVGTAHLGIFGSAEALLATKLEIYRDSPAKAVLAASVDDPRLIAAARATKKRLVTFGRAAEADVQLVAADWLDDGSMRLTLRCPER